MTSTVPSYVFTVISLTNSGANRFVYDGLATGKRWSLYQALNASEFDLVMSAGTVLNTMVSPTNQWVLLESKWMGDTTSTTSTNNVSGVAGTAGSQPLNGFMFGANNGTGGSGIWVCMELAIFTNMTSLAHSNIIRYYQTNYPRLNIPGQ